MMVRGDHTFLDLHMAVLPPKVSSTYSMKKKKVISDQAFALLILIPIQSD